MNILLSSRLSKDKIKTFWSLEWGKNAGQRKSTGIFTYTRPKDLVEKNQYLLLLAISYTSFT